MRGVVRKCVLCLCLPIICDTKFVLATQRSKKSDPQYYRSDGNFAPRKIWPLRTRWQKPIDKEKCSGSDHDPGDERGPSLRLILLIPFSFQTVSFSLQPPASGGEEGATRVRASSTRLPFFAHSEVWAILLLCIKADSQFDSACLSFRPSASASACGATGTAHPSPLRMPSGKSPVDRL